MNGHIPSMEPSNRSSNNSLGRLIALVTVPPILWGLFAASQYEPFTGQPHPFKSYLAVQAAVIGLLLFGLFCSFVSNLLKKTVGYLTNKTRD